MGYAGRVDIVEWLFVLPPYGNALYRRNFCKTDGASMKLIPLSRLLVNGRADDHPVAVQRGQQICFGQFRADVMAATSRFDGCRSVALVCQDSYNFIVGFFGLLHAGATIVIPPNGQFGSLC